MNANTTAALAADSGLHWQEGFSRLGESFFTRLSPRPLPSPYWVGVSRSMAGELGLSDEWMASQEALEAFTGNIPLAGAEPLASVYSGHQFGVWAGQLGDGRAILLGETDKGKEIQLKGSGLTPYSRMGDGRAVLRSSIREFLCSEAMHALGVPTSRALCVTGSNAPVRRETIETAAVVTRVAPSFVRFGHFEHFAYSGQHDELKKLADYVIDRYYPECRDATTLAGNPYANLLQAVSARTAKLMAHWQAVGFCHGVMNTDNMSILGLTIDYGPFQFLDGFNPAHICNHSDTQGRYAFDRQPAVAWWNLHCLAQALMPLIDDAHAAEEALSSYEAVFTDAYLSLMRAKLGLLEAREGDAALVQGALALLAAEQVDWTIFWRRLSHAQVAQDFAPVRELFLQPAGFDAWLLQYQELTTHMDRRLMADLMLKSNPKYVLRNYLAEQAIAQAKLGRFEELQTLQTLLARPFDEHPGFEAYAGFPPDWASHISISCSS